MRICAVADVHISEMSPCNPVTPDADVLIVSGDLTSTGKILELYRFRTWLDAQPQKHKIVIAGNHDFCLQKESLRQNAEDTLKGTNLTYLRDSGFVLDGVSFYGSPWQPWFYDWAFNLPRGAPLAKVWKQIPNDLDILLVHGPPYGIGDRTLSGQHAGCQDLLQAVNEKRPRVVSFGHIHEAHGYWKIDDINYLNCSIGYRVGHSDVRTRNPILFDYENKQVNIIPQNKDQMVWL